MRDINVPPPPKSGAGLEWRANGRIAPRIIFLKYLFEESMAIGGQVVARAKRERGMKTNFLGGGERGGG